eukprot:jgi/Botrbrau1/23531/Bobra.0141s0003.1
MKPTRGTERRRGGGGGGGAERGEKSRKGNIKNFLSAGPAHMSSRSQLLYSTTSSKISHGADVDMAISFCRPGLYHISRTLSGVECYQGQSSILKAMRDES